MGSLPIGPIRPIRPIHPIHPMQRALIFIAILLVALVAFAQFLRRTSMFFPERYPLGNWDAQRGEDVWITTRDKVRLHGWLYRAADPHAPLLLFFHGNAGNITERAPIASGFAQHGISVLLFDWRGYGRSEGEPSESALFDDAEAVYQYAKSSDVVLYGESLGGPYAASIAKKHGARALILDSTFPSLAALGNTLYWPLPIGATAPFALRTRAWANESHVPTLVLHSRNDDVIPFRLGKTLFDELQVPKQMLTSDVRGHCAISFDDPRYFDTVARFVKSAHSPRT